MKTRILIFISLLAAIMLRNVIGQESPGGGVRPANQAEVNAGTVSNKYVSPKTLSGWSGGGGGTNFSGQIITNFIRQVVLDTGSETNIVISWDATNAVVSSPASNFAMTLSGTPPSGFYQKIPWTLVVTNGATTSAVFPLALPNGDTPAIRTPPSTNTFVIVSDGTRQWIEGGTDLYGYLPRTIAGTGGANTNFTGYAWSESSYLDGGTTNVSLVVMPGVSGRQYFATFIISNLTTTSRTVSLSAVTNFWRGLQQYDGITQPMTLTNKHTGWLACSFEGTNSWWSWKQSTNGF